MSGFTGEGCTVEGLVVTTTVSDADEGLAIVGAEEVGEGTVGATPVSVFGEEDGVAAVVAISGVATGVGLAGGALEGVTSTTEVDAGATELLGFGEDGCGSGATVTVSGSGVEAAGELEDEAVLGDDAGLLAEEGLPPLFPFEGDPVEALAIGVLLSTDGVVAVDKCEALPVALLATLEPLLGTNDPTATADVLGLGATGAGAAGAVSGRSMSTAVEDPTALGVLTSLSGVATEAETGVLFSAVEGAGAGGSVFAEGLSALEEGVVALGA